jgi:hypothetical protein
MSLQVDLMKEEDIDGAIDTIQQAFDKDPVRLPGCMEEHEKSETDSSCSTTIGSIRIRHR